MAQQPCSPPPGLPGPPHPCAPAPTHRCAQPQPTSPPHPPQLRYLRDVKAAFLKRDALAAVVALTAGGWATPLLPLATSNPGVDRNPAGARISADEAAPASVPGTDRRPSPHHPTPKDAAPPTRPRPARPLRKTARPPPGPLSRHPRMSDEDHLTVQLVLSFVRNLLAVPDPPPAEAKGGRLARMQARGARGRRGWGVDVGSRGAAARTAVANGPARLECRCQPWCMSTGCPWRPVETAAINPRKPALCPRHRPGRPAAPFV
jgi:hypothetical protein